MVEHQNSAETPMGLTKEDIHTIVSENIYSVPADRKFVSRCVDGRYPNSKELPALALPGGDAGEMAVIMAAYNQYGFELDEGKALDALTEVIGDKKSFSYHSDSHAPHDVLGAGCGHLKQMSIDPGAYNLKPEQVERITKGLLPLMDGAGAKQTVLEGDHKEGAAIQIEGDFGVLPQHNLEAEEGATPIQVFIYHKSLVDARHKVLAKKLIETGAVSFLTEGHDADYLAQVLSEVAEDHTFETLKRLAKGKPLYNVSIKNETDFTVEDLGTI